MKIINDTTEFYIEEATAVVIGKFDGFHRGHQSLLDKVMEQKSKGLATVVFTFVPSPGVFFSGRVIPELTTVAEKRTIFEKAGVDYLVEYPFYQEIADTEPVSFISDVLVGKINAKCIVAGEDISYGKRGAGDSKLLKEKASEFGYEVIIIDKVQYEGREVSSTYVREAVKNGEMELAATLLGSLYRVSGTVVHGRQLGRTIGMPTVNVLPPEDKLLPPNGVYYSYVFYNGKRYESITNIGVKPTVDQSEVMGVESYIYNFNEDIYDKYIEVQLMEFKRPEMRFGSVDELKAQMEADLAAGREYHGFNN